jgi:hypothetical protein
MTRDGLSPLLTGQQPRHLPAATRDSVPVRPVTGQGSMAVRQNRVASAPLAVTMSMPLIPQNRGDQVPAIRIQPVTPATPASASNATPAAQTPARSRQLALRQASPVASTIPYAMELSGTLQTGNSHPSTAPLPKRRLLHQPASLPVRFVTVPPS